MDNLAYVIVDNKDHILAYENTYMKAREKAKIENADWIYKIKDFDGQSGDIVDAYVVITSRDMLIQRIYGIVFIVLSLVIPFALEGDITPSIALLPVGLYLLFTDEFWLIKS